MKSRKQILKERLIWVAAFLFGLLIYLGLILSTAFIRRRYGLKTSGAGDGTGHSDGGHKGVGLAPYQKDHESVGIG